MSDQPNFLLFITDQHRADHLGCYGNKIVQTPNIDDIAARGTKFERFYVSCPICMPNRATLMTGRMPSLHGVRQNGIPLSLNATTFTHVLQSAGYRTALFGKSHLQCISANAVEVGLPVPDPKNFSPLLLSPKLHEIFGTMGIMSRSCRQLGKTIQISNPNYLFMALKKSHWPSAIVIELPDTTLNGSPKDIQNRIH